MAPVTLANVKDHRCAQGVCALAVAVAACCVPWVWVSFPAAVLLVVWWPGRSLVRLLGGVNAMAGATWLSVATSLVLMPVPLTWLWQWTHSRWCVLAVVAGMNLALMALGRRGETSGEPPPMFYAVRTRRLFGGMVVWLAGWVFASFWLPSATGGYTVTAAHDYIKHHAVMLSLERYPLPLHNVFYAAESDTPYYYYHYPYLVPAAVRTLAGNGVSIAFAFGLFAAALAAVCVGLVYLLACEILGSERGALLASACAGLVGGFDIIPVMIRVAAGASMPVTLDSWCPVAWRIHNLTTQYLWCPQHVAALVTLLICACWLRRAPERRWWILVAPLMGASIFGSSVYLAMTSFAAAAVYVVLRFVATARRDGDEARRLVLAVGAIAGLGLVLMGYQAWQYAEMADRYGGGLTARWERFPLAFLGRLLPPGPLANWADAVWLLLVELGLPAVACLLVTRRWWARLWADEGMRLLMIAGGLGTAALLTFRSDVHTIDYGFRVAIMPAMVVAAVAAGAMMTRPWLRPIGRMWRQPIVVIGVLVGLAVGLYELPVTAIRRVLEKPAVRQDAGAFDYLREQTPTDAVVQGDPRGRLALTAVTNRQQGVADPENAHVAVFRSMDPERMQDRAKRIEAAMASGSSREIHDALAEAGVDYLLVGSVERKRFGSELILDDPKRFEIVYTDSRDEPAMVYRLLTRSPDNDGRTE